MGKKTDKNGLFRASTGSNPKVTAICKSFLEHKSLLKRYISQFIKHPHDIEDIVHDAFLNSYAAELNTKIHRPRAFLYQTARNLALKHLNKSSTRLTDNLADLDLSEVLIDRLSPEDSIESHEEFALFCKAAQKLPLQCRRAFILRKVYGLSHKEIASHLDISVSTVEKHLATGVSRCLDFMRSRGFTYKPGKITSERKKS